MTSVIDRLSGWTIDRWAFARQRYQRAVETPDMPPVRLSATFMERQGRADQYGSETMDVDAAQRLATTSSWVFSDIQVIAGRVASDAARPVAARYVDGKWVEEWDHPMTLMRSATLMATPAHTTPPPNKQSPG